MEQRENSRFTVSVCDPSPPDLARTIAMVRRALDGLPQGRRASVRAYATSAALLAGPPCHLCVTETALDGTDGFALARRVRERQAGAAVIFVTGDAGDGTARRATECRAAGCLLKPLERPEDLERLRAMLDDSLRGAAPSAAYGGSSPISPK